MKRWSKLQRQLYNLVEQDIRFQLHCIVYPMKSQRGSTGLPRYWITIGKKIIWEYPGQLIQQARTLDQLEKESGEYPYITGISDISALIREYIDTPKDALTMQKFESDKWGLIPILQAADRRLGKQKLMKLREHTNHPAAREIIDLRLKTAPTAATPAL